MKPADNTDPPKRAILCEQCWLGLALMIFWSLVVMAFFFGCSVTAGSLAVGWDANPIAQQVTKYIVRVDEAFGLASYSAETAGTTHTFPNIPRHTNYLVTVVAVNVTGVSLPSVITYYLPGRIRLTRMKSNLQTWTAFGSEEFNVTNPSEFYRLKIETIP